MSYLQNSANLVWRLEAEANRIEDESAVNGFGAERSEINEYNLGISRGFETGTQFTTELTNSDRELTFPAAFGGGFGDFIGRTQFSEPRLTFTLSQKVYGKIL